jgi:hypothetical protein
MKVLAKALVLLEVIWTAVIWGGLILLGDDTAGTAMLGLVMFLVWGMSQFALVPMALLALGYLAIDWALDAERHPSSGLQSVIDEHEPRIVPPA